MDGDESIEALVVRVKTALGASGPLAAFEEATAILLEQPLFFLEYGLQSDSNDDSLDTVMRGALALRDYRAGRACGASSDSDSWDVLRRLSLLSSPDADRLFFAEFLPSAKAARDIERTISSYYVDVLPKLEAEGEDLRGRLEKLNQSISVLFIDADESRRRHRYGIARSLINKQDDANARWMLSKYESDLMEARHGWAAFYDVASRSDDVSAIQNAQAALRRFIATNKDDGTWEDFRPVVDRYLNEFLESVSQRGYQGDLKPLQADRTTWRAGDYRDALMMCRAVEDAMGSKFDRQRFDQLTTYSKAASLQSSSYSDAQLAIMQTVLEELGIRLVTHQIAHLKTSGKSPKEIAELTGKLLDELPLDVLYESNVDAVKRWLGDAWQDLHELTRNYLPKAEAVLDFLQRANEKELSPFVLEYCRALENELVQKAFTSFLGQVGEQLSDEVIAEAKAFKKTEKLAKDVEARREPTLGDFVRLIGLCKPGGKTRGRIELVERFGAYLESRFGPEVVEPAFRERLEALTVLRNAAAHPRSTPPDDAAFAKDEVRDVLTKWLQLYRGER